VVTRSEKGCVVVSRAANEAVRAAPIDRFVDATGAGDLFAAGFLSARCRGRELAGCLEVGALCAAEVISHFGARPEADLRELVRL